MPRGVPDPSYKGSAKQREDDRLSSARLKERRRQIVRAYKTVPCTDCGIQYPYWVMDLDHVRGEKIKDIARMANTGTPIAVLLAELEKTEPVCANCHRDRTYRRLKDKERMQ